MRNITNNFSQAFTGPGATGLDGLGTFCVIQSVDSEKRTCTITTNGCANRASDGYYTDVQWLNSFSGLNGEEIGSIPQIGDLGVCLFVGGSPWILGFYNAIMDDPDEPVENPEGEEIEGAAASAASNKFPLLSGDISLRTKGACRVTLKASGQMELEATKVCRTVFSPTQNKISDICQNYQMQSGGGSIEWGHTSKYSEEVKCMQVYRDTIRSNNVVTQEYGKVEPDSDIIWRVTVGSPAAPAFLDPNYIKLIHTTGAVETVINKNASQHFIDADGTTVHGVGGFKYYHEIRPSGSVVMCVGSSYSMVISEAGFSMDFGPGSATQVPGMPPIPGKGKFSMTILPTGAFKIDVGGKGQFIMDALGGVALATAGRGTIAVDAAGVVSLTAASAVRIIGPSVSLEAGKVALGQVPIDNVPLGTLLVSAINMFIADFKSHTHAVLSKDFGTTSPPMGSSTRAIVGSTVLSQTVKVQA